MAKKLNFHKRIKKQKAQTGRKINKMAAKIVKNEPLKIKNLRHFAETHTKMLMATFVVAVALIAGTIWIINYNMAYEYSYNGKVLGVVKDQETVLKVTDLVQEALTVDKDVEVVIDKKNDISFERISIFGTDTHIDTSEDVLRRMTYVGDISVKGYGIMVNGQTAAVVDSEETAKDVLNTIKAEAVTKGDDVIVESSEFKEKVKIAEFNTNLDNLQSADEAQEKLEEGGTLTVAREVEKGETLVEIMTEYDMSEDEIMELNPDINPKKLEEGSTIQVLETAPMLTLVSSELVTYEEKIDYEIIETKSDEMYKGDTKIETKGEKGLRLVTCRVEKVNGKKVETDAIVEIVDKEPVTQVQIVGTKKRPPSVGDGKFIWPTNGSYRISSEFGWRWGRNHNGIDMACSQGTNVLAADGGVVTYAGYKGSFGNLVIIDHQNGFETYYAHNSSLLVSPGDKVYEGYHIAESGNTGRSTGPHIHFEIRVNGTPKNPRNYLP